MKTRTTNDAISVPIPVHAFRGELGRQLLLKNAKKIMDCNTRTCLLIGIDSISSRLLGMRYPNVKFVAMWFNDEMETKAYMENVRKPSQGGKGTKSLDVFVKDPVTSDSPELYEIAYIENMKFDCCIMNPPYDGNLHLQILERVLNFCDKVVNVSPIRKYTSIKNIWDGYSRKEYLGLPGLEHLVELEPMERTVMSGIFGKAFTMDMGIQVFDASQTVDNSDATKFIALGNPCKTVIRKIMQKCQDDNITKHRRGSVILRHGRYLGKVNSFLNVTYESQLKSSGNKVVHFDNEEDRHDFYTFWTGKHGRLLVSLWKNTNDVYPRYIPYFWAKPGQEKERIMEYFDLSEEEFEELLSIES